jgi:hypothetical protein
LIELIGEFDAAQGWREWGMRSTADWLSWQTGIGLNAGREQVRVARALRELPLVAAEFGAGRLSYSKARALTRIATAESEVDLVQMAEHATAAQIENFVAATRRAIRASDVRARRKASYLQWHQDDDGSIVGSFRLSPEQGAPFCHAVDAGTGKLVDLIGEGDPGEDKAARQRRSAAEVLGLMAEAFLRDVSAETSTEGAERYQLVLHTTAEELAMRDDADADADDDGAGTVVAGGNGRQWRVAPSTALRLTCDCPASTMVDGPDGHALHLGRKTRRIRGPLRRAVHARPGHVRCAWMYAAGDADPSRAALGARRPDVSTQPDQPVRRSSLAGPRRRVHHRAPLGRRLGVDVPRRCPCRSHSRAARSRRAATGEP